MKINFVHNFDNLTEKEFIKIQNQLKKQINISKRVNLDEIKYCAGVDVAYWEEKGKTLGACSIVVLDFKTKEIIEKVESFGEIKVPYISGYLAFRELPIVLEAAKKLVTDPDIFIFDGNGVLHENNMGIATHASFFLEKPTIGVAKKYLKINNMEFKMPKNIVGDCTQISYKNKTLGLALRTMKSAKPVFVSSGNYIDLQTSYSIVMKLLSKDSKVPIPTRLADIETHILREKSSIN